VSASSGLKQKIKLRRADTVIYSTKTAALYAANRRWPWNVQRLLGVTTICLSTKGKLSESAVYKLVGQRQPGNADNDKNLTRSAEVKYKVQPGMPSKVELKKQAMESGLSEAAITKAWEVVRGDNNGR
jgi:hypothetical protein